MYKQAALASLFKTDPKVLQFVRHFLPSEVIVANPFRTTGMITGGKAGALVGGILGGTRAMAWDNDQNFLEGVAKGVGTGMLAGGLGGLAMGNSMRQLAVASAEEVAKARAKQRQLSQEIASAILNH